MTTRTGAVVVVNYASSHLLRDDLSGLAAPDAPYRVVVVDNFSSAAERAAMRTLAPSLGWELVEAVNDGFGAGVNLGAARARALGCTSLLLLNPDVRISPSAVAALLDHVERAPDDVVTPALLQADGSPGFPDGTLDLVRGVTRARGVRDRTHELWLSGACLALSAELWDRLGGLDERYFLYWEDIDLSHRCLVLGARLVVRKDLSAVHAAGGTQGPGKSPLYFYFNCRNRMLFARTHLDRRQVARWLLASPRYGWRVLWRSGRRPVLRGPAVTVLPVLRGTLAGVRVGLTGRVPARSPLRLTDAG